jgi:flagellin-like hook-associated protein FlgL
MYVFASNAGASVVKSIKVTDDMSISVNTPGSEVFGRAILALESLGRALSNYDTTVDNGAATGAGTTFTTIQDQTSAISAALDLLKRAREEDIMPERVNLGGRMKRLEAAESVLELSSFSAKQVLNQLQDTDFAESASNLSQAQTALEASLAVSSRILQQSILDYL